MAEEIFDPLRRTVEGVATGVGDVVGGIGKGISSAVGGVGDAVGGLLGGFQNMPADDRMALINTLGRTGAALMALGQPGYNPKLRQQAIMALGNVPGQVATDRFKSAQSKLMTAQMQNAQRKLDSIKKLDALRSTPEGIASIYKQTGFDTNFIKSADPEILEKAIVEFAIRNASMSPAERRMRQLAGLSTSGPQLPGAPVSPTQPTPTGAGVEPPAAGPATEAAPAKPAQAAPTDAYSRYKSMLSDPIIATSPDSLVKIRKAMESLDPARFEKEVTDAKQYESRGKGLLDQTQKLFIVKKEIANAKERYGDYSGPLLGSVANIPLFHADIDSSIKAIQANLGFATLAEMRAASKTGGALGNVSDKDLELLHSTLGKLQLGMSRKAFNKSLSDIDRILSAAQRRSKNIFESTYKKKFNPNEFGGELETFAPSGGASPGGYRVIGVR